MRVATDENFNGNILAGLKARLPALDVIRIQDTVMYQAPDSKLLAWLDQENCILLTHDVRTMPRYVYERIRTGKRVTGVIEVREGPPIGKLIHELELLLGAGEADDFENIIHYI